VNFRVFNDDIRPRFMFHEGLPYEIFRSRDVRYGSFARPATNALWIQSGSSRVPKFQLEKSVNYSGIVDANNAQDTFKSCQGRDCTLEFQSQS
jgi:hypothetical protein